ncbi:MAG: DNA methyltransferase, partial [Cyanobacteriota bacterium]
LVQLLIVSALLPVIADRLSKATTQQEKEAALLAIRVLDPACGSGHFLLAAARRLALELARIRAGAEEPREALRPECLREVVAHCIYGVDKNPMAVELCKVALWIEAIEPGKPLSFLDAHIQCGDSLVGVFDPKLLEQGIPDEAYKPLTGY